MPAAMHLTVLVSLFAVAVSQGSSTNTTAKQVAEITTSAAHNTSLAAKNNVSEFTVPTADNTQQPPTTTHQINTSVTSENVSSSPPQSTSPQTPNRTEETHFTPSQITTSNLTSNETVSHERTFPSTSESPNITATTTVNTTSPGLPQEWEKGDLATRPGLVAIICVFCIAFVLLLVFAFVKCIRSSRNNFERLEDVQMSKVNETSPFAQHSK